MDGTVLVADDDRTIRTVLTQALTRAGCKVHATGSLMTLMRWVEEGMGDLVITDVIMPDGNGLQALPQITRMRPGLPVIVISAQNTLRTAVQATEAAAFDYLPKPFDLPDLMKRSARALEQRRGLAKVVEARAPSEDLPLVGRTPAMQAIYRLIARVMNTDLAVLILGESGTGKSLIARAIHDLSDRRSQPFVVARSDDLAGADGLAALMARAKAGSLVLEEVGDFSDDVQARLVRMLDQITAPAPRIMATSQADLAQAVGQGTFRKDLYYRLAGVSLTVPPLRDRVEDIALLIDHVLARGTQGHGSPRHLSPEASAVMRTHPWPGNVRQLENLLHGLMVTSNEAEITKAEVVAALGPAGAAPRPSDPLQGETLAQSVARHVQRYFDLHGDQLPPNGVYDRVLREIEVPMIEIALEATGGNQAKCADLLGINRNTLRKKLTDLDISVTRRRKLM